MIWYWYNKILKIFWLWKKNSEICSETSEVSLESFEISWNNSGFALIGLRGRYVNRVKIAREASLTKRPAQTMTAWYAGWWFENLRTASRSSQPANWRNWSIWADPTSIRDKGWRRRIGLHCDYFFALEQNK